MQENTLLTIMEIAGPIVLLVLFVWVISARSLGCEGSTHAPAGFMKMPSGKGSIQEPRRAIAPYSP